MKRFLVLPPSRSSYTMSGVFPFFHSFEKLELGPTNSGSVYVAQKPFSSSAPRMLTWINATSIGICNTPVSISSHDDTSLTDAHPPTPLFAKSVQGIGSTMCDIHFRSPTIRQGSCNTLINGCLLLGTPTCCLNRWTFFRVSMVVHLVSLALRMVQPISP